MPARPATPTLNGHADPNRLAVARPMPDVGGRAQGAVQAAFNHPQGGCVDCHTEHEGATAMPVTQQRFCSDCHGSLNQRLTEYADHQRLRFRHRSPRVPPGDHDRSAAFRPTVRRLSLEARPLEDNGLKFPHDVHLSSTNSVARMAQSFGGLYGFGDRGMVCANCHVPDSSGARFQPITMEQNCQMCHSLSFDQIGGTIGTLRHGDVDQTVADIRASIALPCHRGRATSATWYGAGRVRRCRRRPLPTIIARRRRGRPVPMQRSGRCSRRAAPASIAIA